VRHSPPFEPALSLLAGLIEERLGLRYGETELQILADGVEPRVAAAGCPSLLEYYTRLRDDGADSEWTALADQLVVGETYFFRELSPLEVLVDEEIAPRVRRGVAVRIWSAGCASGEEPLTLAMLLADRRCLEGTTIVATDVSPAALARARCGRHPAHALRLPVLPEPARRWLTRHPDGSLDVAPELLAQVRWQTGNLLTATPPLGPFDVILCRNVFIYFSDRATRVVMANLTEALRPGGVLAVGVSESLHRFSPALSCEEHRGAFYYRRVATEVTSP
jgi:chemotaxis protein methyltransferase CheR